jgi:N-(2-amino-2-carboxyethyl)-L-glutamate synthase
VALRLPRAHTVGEDELIRASVLDAIGGTPLVKLSRLYAHCGLELFAKLEAANPGGSLKDRPAWNIIRNALEAGEIDAGTVVVESSSGNMGIGLAQVCRYLGLRFICVVDSRTTSQNLALLRAYGSEVEMVTEPDPVTGEFLQARIARVHALVGEYPRTFWANQYANRHNSDAHAQTTMREIAESLDGDVDYVFCATSTCGTVRGCAEYIHAAGMSTKVVAVDAVGSVIFARERARRIIPGFGAGMVPELFDPQLVDMHVQVSDLECVVGCRRLVRREAIMAGGSAGGIVMAVERLRAALDDGSRCALVFCDRGERYLDTIFSDAWVTATFGDIGHLWADPTSLPPGLEHHLRTASAIGDRNG